MADEGKKKETKKKETKKVAPVQQLYGKFGEFDGYEELNKAAEGQLKDGDIDSLRLLAKENGIDADDVEDYIEGVIPSLCTPMTAAIGRLRAEFETFKSLQPGEKEACIYIAKIAQTMTIDEEFAKVMTKKGKRIHDIDKIMYDARLSCGTDDDLKKIIKAYYMSGQDEAKKIVNKIKEESANESI